MPRATEPLPVFSPDPDSHPAVPDLTAPDSTPNLASADPLFRFDWGHRVEFYQVAIRHPEKDWEQCMCVHCPLYGQAVL